jgi:DNA end-binding protein Ku
MPAKTKKAPTVAMPRASAKITLMFGMVSIPVAMRPLAHDRRKGVSGRILCPEHMEPCTQLYECRHDEKKPHTMTKSETVIGYETAKDSGTFVTLPDDVIESLVQDREQAASIRQFVPTSAIDPIYYEKQYAIWPQDGAGQPYDLFLLALRSENLSAILTATISKQTRTFSVRWSEPLGCLVASLLYFDTDLRWEDGEAIAASVEDRSGTITDEHVAVARSLVQSLLGEFDSGEVADTYTETLREAIAAAAEGKAPAAAKPKQVQAASTDLLASLKASVAASAKPKAKAKA